MPTKTIARLRELGHIDRRSALVPSRPLPQRDHFDHISVIWRRPLPQVPENGILSTLCQCTFRSASNAVRMKWRNSKDSVVKGLVTKPALHRFHRVVAGPVATTARKNKSAYGVAGVAATRLRKHDSDRVVEEQMATTVQNRRVVRIVAGTHHGIDTISSPFPVVMRSIATRRIATRPTMESDVQHAKPQLHIYRDNPPKFRNMMR